MRLAVLGDIHGNAPALQAVLAAAETLGVETLCITGDLVGYYYWPAEVMKMLEGWPRYCVRGNHEDMLVRAATDPAFLVDCTKRYGSGLASALKSLSPSQFRQLESLPGFLDLNLAGRHIILAHGSPREIGEYLYPDASEKRLGGVAISDADWIFLGHTHYRMLKEVSGSKIVNPGSVGQPRDKCPGASWAFIDLTDDSVEFRTESYNISLVAGEAGRRDPNLPYLKDILFLR